MSSNIPHPLETLLYVKKQLVCRGDAHLIQTLLHIEKEYSSSCSVLEDEHLSQLHLFLDTLQRVEEECGSFRMFSDEIHLLETLNWIEEQWGSFRYYMFPEEPNYILVTLERLAKASCSFNMFLEGYHFSEESRPLDTVLRIEENWGSVLVFSDEYLSMLSHLRETLLRIEEECTSFYMFLREYLFPQEPSALAILLHIEEDWGSFRMYLDEFRSKLSNFLEIPGYIGDECSSFIVFLETYLLSSEDTQQWMEDEWSSFDFFSEEHVSSIDRLKFLKRDFKFLSIIIYLHIYKDEPDFSWEKVRALFHGAADELIQLYSTQVSPWSHHFYDYICQLQHEFHQTKLELIRASYSFPEISCRLLANEDGIVILKFVMKFIEVVTDNFSNLLKFDDPSSSLCIGGPMMVQIKKVLKELNILYSLVCFVSERCIEPQVRHAFFTHVLQEAWETTKATWLFLPSNEYMYQDRAPNEENPLLSYLLQIKIPPIHILQDLNLLQSRWYPVIQIKYVFDCEVGYLKSLRDTLKELRLPISSNCIAIKANLQETLNFFGAILVNLPTQAIEFHLQDMDSVIVNAGLLVYSLHDNDNDNLDFPGKIQSMQALIYFIARKKFLLQFNLPGIDGAGCADFILDNREKFLSMYSDSVDSVKSQRQTIQKELKCFQTVVEQQDGLQHFATKTTRLVYEVERMFDACKKKDVPDWCLFIWILNIGEDIRMLMAEVAEVQEKNVSDFVLHDEISSSPHKLTSFMQLVPKGFLWIVNVVSSPFARKRRINIEIVGFEDVMVELKGNLIGGSSDLDVVSIVGMAGLGKTTLANKLYFDESVVSYFDIHAHCCVSQEYTRKDLLLVILRGITDERAKLERETENELADKLRKLLMRKRYLVLIDDVWDTSAWDDLKLCFPEDNRGSRIILTTRHYGVASHAKHNSEPHRLRFLNSDESWMLFNNKVFNNESCPLILRDVGQQIVRKCGGLPLSIILVAGILRRMKREKHCWEQVATNLGPNIQDQMERTLDMSYQNLPHYLKPCFLYLGVFPEDGEIQVSKLTWLWIAEGFIKPHTENLLEDTAKHYLENLIGRNLVMVAKKSFDGRIKTCRIHDLVLEFCKKKAKSTNILEMIKGDTSSDPSQYFPPKCSTSRRLSIYSQCDNLATWCLCFSHVKSFQFRESRRIAFSSIDRASDIFKRFKFLRVLDFEFTMIDSFPQELTLLRYLAFRAGDDTLTLPANLWNLETLIVQGTRGRVSLPDTIWKMVKLRHLQIHDQAFFTLQNEQEFLESPSKMDDLQTLSSAYFSCVENAGKILAKTPNLQKLRCEVSKFDGSFPAFNNLTMLKILKISSSPTLTLIDQLKFPSHLKKLTMSNFNMHLNEVTTFSNLEVLKLLGVTISSNTWKVNDEQFGKLKFLKLENPSFSEWNVSDDAFPSLEQLVLKRCRYLNVIPSCFGYMPCLKSIAVNSCKESLAKSAMVIKEMQVEEMGYSDFEVIIHR